MGFVSGRLKPKIPPPWAHKGAGSLVDRQVLKRSVSISTHPRSYENDCLFPVQKVTIVDTVIGEVVIRQISCISAGRSTTLGKTGSEVRIGERYGDILFGSTVVLEVPDNIELTVEAPLQGRPPQAR